MTMDHTTEYGVTEFVEDAKRIMETSEGASDRESAVRALEPLLRRGLDGPGWEDPRYATITESGRPISYYRNPEASLHIYGVLFRPDAPGQSHLTFVRPPMELCGVIRWPSWVIT